MRSVAAPALALLQGPAVSLALLVHMDFDTPVLVNSSAHDVTYGGDTYLGAGALGAVEPIADEAGQPPGLRFELSGVPSANIALALQESVRGTPVAVRLAVIDPDDWTVEDAPLIWSGTLDQMAISHGRETSSIAVSAIHRGETLRRPKPLRQTDADQQLLVPGDTSRRYVVSQAQQKDVWPAAAWGRV